MNQSTCKGVDWFQWLPFKYTKKREKRTCRRTRRRRLFLSRDAIGRGRRGSPLAHLSRPPSNKPLGSLGRRNSTSNPSPPPKKKSAPNANFNNSNVLDTKDTPSTESVAKKFKTIFSAGNSLSAIINDRRPSPIQVGSLYQHRLPFNITPTRLETSRVSKTKHAQK